MLVLLLLLLLLLLQGAEQGHAKIFASQSVAVVML